MTTSRTSVRQRFTRVAMPLLLVTALVASCGGTGEADATAASSSTDVELFDPSVVHAVSVELDQGDYDEMIATYTESDEKTWIEATVTIDGVTYERAGLRLKGNSSLRGLAQSAGAEDAGARGGFGGFGGGADADSPESLPWLIRLDKFVDGQLHQGAADLVIRSNQSETALNEAVALDLLEAAGLASQQAISTTFSVNGSDEVLRLAVEHPDDDAWQDRAFSGDGALYKAESSGDWSYRGDDLAAYDEVFDQEGGENVADLTPLIELLKFVDESDDATFVEQLPELLDVESFATYLAMMDLVENSDDIDGPGNNAYLWWDAATEQFTIVPWDMNLAFGGLGGGFGGGPGGMGGRGQQGMTPPEGFEPPEGFDPSQLPEGMTPPDGMTPPEGVDPGQAARGGQQPGGAGGTFGRSNPLVERFHSTAELEALYQAALDDLRAELFAGGAAEAALDARVQVLQDGQSIVDAATIESDATALRERLSATAAAGD